MALSSSTLIKCWDRGLNLNFSNVSLINRCSEKIINKCVGNAYNFTCKSIRHFLTTTPSKSIERKYHIMPINVTITSHFWCHFSVSYLLKWEPGNFTFYLRIKVWFFVCGVGRFYLLIVKRRLNKHRKKAAKTHKSPGGRVEIITSRF